MRHWILVLVYIVPIVGSLVAMIRRARSLYSFGESFRRLLPDDRFYRRIRLWQSRAKLWLEQRSLVHNFHLDTLNLQAGRLEYALGHLRDYTIGLYMVGMAVFETAVMVLGHESVYGVGFKSVFYHTFFALLSIFTYRRHVATGLQISEFLRVNPSVHPQEFFDHYYRRLGPMTVPIPLKAIRTVDPHDLSFLTGKPPEQGVRFLLRGLFDTAIFARSAYRAMDTLGPVYGREVFDRMAQLWGKRILQLFRCRLLVCGDEKLSSLPPGKVILVFNHKSHLDFVLNFFALSATPLRLADRLSRGIRPRYLAARDHFVSNKFVYEGLGVGRLIEAVDMIFVDRKRGGRQAVLSACETLAQKDVEIALYPQGTRAYGNCGRRGERWDAGYYTTGSLSSLKRPMGHLKKGAAYLAVDTALCTAVQNRPVHVVCIGIEGTGTIVPKGSFKVQTESTVQFTVGDVITLNPEQVRGIKKPESERPVTEAERRYEQTIDQVRTLIDQTLVKALGLHEKLESRFVADLREKKLLPTDRFFVMKRNLNVPAFVILDRIYALAPAEWDPFLSELASLLASESPHETAVADLCERVTDRLIGERGRESKRVVLEERRRAAG